MRGVRGSQDGRYREWMTAGHCVRRTEPASGKSPGALHAGERRKVRKSAGREGTSLLDDRDGLLPFRNDSVPALHRHGRVFLKHAWAATTPPVHELYEMVLAQGARSTWGIDLRAAALDLAPFSRHFRSSPRDRTKYAGRIAGVASAPAHILISALYGQTTSGGNGSCVALDEIDEAGTSD